MNAQNKIEENTPGWDAIDKSLQKLYKEQVPQHYAPKVYYSLGGEEPLDGEVFSSTKRTVATITFLMDSQNYTIRNRTTNR